MPMPAAAMSGVAPSFMGMRGARPRDKQSPGHNHSSQLLSVGTPDTSVSRELVDFIERTGRAASTR